MTWISCRSIQEAAAHYGKIRQELSRRGELIGPLDLLIAAHARSRDATLVTNNEREFSARARPADRELAPAG